jgi:hypothetical protein
MKNEKWDDQQLEELLSKAPKIQDHRSKEDVFARLKEAGAFEEEPVQLSKKKKRNPFMLFGLTAALTFITFGGVYYFSQSSSEERSVPSYNEENTDQQDKMLESEEEVAEVQEMNIRGIPEEDIRTSVYEEQLGDASAFHIGLAGNDAESVPVTIVIPKEKLVEDFGKETPTQVEMYNKYAPALDEQAAGFTELHPVKGTIEEQGKTVVHTLPANHGYDESPGTAAVYTGMLKDTFGKSYNKVIMQNKDGAPVTFKEVGTPSEPLDLDKAGRYSYFLDEQENGIFLAPNFHRTFDTVIEALEYMKVEENDVYKTAILPGVDYTVTDGDIVKVTFAAPLDLEAVDSQQAMHMIEAMLLTASGFDKQILFENIVQTEWRSFYFTEPLPKPVGANELPVDLIERK